MKIKIPFTNRSFELRFHPSDEPDVEWINLFGRATSAGVNVSEESAMRLTAVYSCIRVLSEAVAQLPLKVYERLQEGGKREAKEHPIYPLVHDSPDDGEMTSFNWRETMTAHLCTHGNAYSFIDFGKNGRPKKIVLLKPDKVIPKRLETNNLIVYEYLHNGGVERFRREQVLHVPGLGYDGIVGYSPIRVLAESIGTGIAANMQQASVFKNGTIPSGVLLGKKALNQEAVDRLKKQWNDNYSGAANARKTIILEDDMDYKPISITAVDAQLIETMKFTRSEIAGAFRVPAHLINDLDKATFSNIEQLSLEFVMYTLTPWLTRIEQVMNYKLFLPSERGRYFVEFVTDGLLRGDVKSRNEAHRIAIMGGWKSINEVRSEENMPPIENGDKHLVQGAMITLDQAVAQGAANNILGGEPI